MLLLPAGVEHKACHRFAAKDPPEKERFLGRSPPRAAARSAVSAFL